MPPVNRMVTRNVEFRSVEQPDGSDGRTISGYAAVYDSPTTINSFEGNFVETVARGAFRKTLESGKFPAMQWAHGRDSRVGQCPIGVYTNMRDDPHGLYLEGRLFENSVVEPVRQAIEAQAISGQSFTFRVVRDSWSDRDGNNVSGNELYRLLFEPGDRGPLQRTLREVELFEAGPVLTPAYAETSVGVRSAEELTDDQRRDLRDEYRRTMVELETAEREVKEAQGDLVEAHLAADRESKQMNSDLKVTNARLIADGFTPDSVERATKDQDWGLLVHGGLQSAELVRDDNTGDAPSDPPITDLDKYDGDSDDTGPVEEEQEDVADHPFVDGMCAVCGY